MNLNEYDDLDDEALDDNIQQKYRKLAKRRSNGVYRGEHSQKRNKPQRRTEVIAEPECSPDDL